MITDRMDDYEGILLTDKIHLQEHFSGEQLEWVKSANGKRLPPTKDDNVEKLEDMYYQSSMFDNQSPDVKEAEKSVRAAKSQIEDNLDKLFDQALDKP